MQIYVAYIVESLDGELAKKHQQKTQDAQDITTDEQIHELYRLAFALEPEDEIREIIEIKD